MATRIAVMSEGRLQQVGPPQAVYERPHNLFVARFIGSPPMNTDRRPRSSSTTARRSCRSASGRVRRSAAGGAASRWSTAPRWSSACGPSTCADRRRRRSQATVRRRRVARPRAPRRSATSPAQTSIVREPSEGDGPPTSARPSASTRRARRDAPLRSRHDRAPQLTAPDRGRRQPDERDRDARRTLKDTLLAAALLLPSASSSSPSSSTRSTGSFYLGLHQQNRFGTAERYVGFEPVHRRAHRRGVPRRACASAARYVLLTVPLGLVLGVLLAVAANRRLRGIKVFQTIFSSTVATLGGGGVGGVLRADQPAGRLLPRRRRSSA